MATTLDRTKSPINPELNPTKVDLSILIPKETVLDNGIRTYSFANDSTEIVKIDFLFRAGTAFQSKSFCSLATTHLLTEGTKTRSAQEIADFLDFRGAYIEKSVEKEDSCITIYSLKKHIFDILPLVKEILEAPAFPESELNLFLSKRKQAFEIESQKTNFIARNKFNELVFGEDHPFGKVGKLEDFALLTRNDLLSFYSSFYANASFDIIVSGNIDSFLIEKLNILFGQSKKVANNQNLKITDIRTTPHAYFQEKEGSVQSTIRLGKTCIAPTHADFAKLSVTNAILGGYFGSRLMKNIREDKGYTYGIYSFLQIFKELSLFIISADVGSNVTEKAIEEVYNEIRTLQTTLPSEEELDILRNYLTGNFIRSIDGVLELSERFKTLLQNGLSIDFFYRYLHTIHEIDPNDIQFFSKKYLSINSFFEVCVGNKNI